MRERLEPIVTKFVYGEVDRRKPGGLPHWDTRRGIQFVTWRLHDSLPRSVEDELSARKKARIARLERRDTPTPEDLDAIEQAYFDEVDVELDRGFGACYMKDPRIANLVEESLHYFDGDRYRILSHSIMLNHVHVIFRLFGDTVLWDLIESWKKYTSREANLILGRRGRFWQKGYFDRLIRDSRELSDRIQYVVNNPRAAGLVNWRWAGFNAEAISEVLARGESLSERLHAPQVRAFSDPSSGTRSRHSESDAPLVPSRSRRSESDAPSDT